MADSHGHSSHVNYFLIFIALCVCTLLSVVADLVHIPNKMFLIVIVLAIATAKALFVMSFFMHLKFEGRWKYVLLAPTIILALGLPMALMPDIGVHYYQTLAPQNAWDAQPIHEGADHGKTEATPAPESAQE